MDGLRRGETAGGVTPAGPAVVAGAVAGSAVPGVHAPGPIRAFEHLAYLLLGQPARSLNHLDVADRLGRDDDGRAGAADRLAHLYEQGATRRRMK